MDGFFSLHFTLALHFIFVLASLSRSLHLHVHFIAFHFLDLGLDDRIVESIFLVVRSVHMNALRT